MLLPFDSENQSHSGEVITKIFDIAQPNGIFLKPPANKLTIMKVPIKPLMGMMKHIGLQWRPDSPKHPHFISINLEKN